MPLNKDDRVVGMLVCRYVAVCIIVFVGMYNGICRCVVDIIVCSGG